MPRGPRLDAPGTLHHVMARGIERAPIFRDDLDRLALLKRLERLANAEAIEVFAWALLPNHFHLLVKTALKPLPAVMRSLLTGHAIWFNRRHTRAGHLFQNRYRSIVCEEEAYFLELVRYIHLNPLRSGIVPSLDALDRYPFSGHSAMVGTVPRRWQRTAAVLRRFAENGDARRAYRRFVSLGVAVGGRPDLSGGGLIRSAGGWAAVRELRRAREAFTHDDRVLGGSKFVEALLREHSQESGTRGVLPVLEEVVRLVCRVTGAEVSSLLDFGRPRPVLSAREGICFLWIHYAGRSGHEVAARLGISPVSAYRCAERGTRSSERWLALVQPKVTK